MFTTMKPVLMRFGELTIPDWKLFPENTEIECIF